MQQRQIANTDLVVSPICLGTMTFGTPVGEAEAVRLTHWALDHGINFIDTANMYEGYTRYVGSPGGVAESILGKALVQRREQAVLATKVGMKVGESPEDEGTSPAAIRKHIDLSLQRLATDYVDLYYLHRLDPGVPMVEVIAALNREITSGKVRHYAVSNYTAEDLSALLQIADENGLPRPVLHQPHYSLLTRGIEEDLLPLCQQEKIGIVPYRVLQGGLLTGKYRRGQAALPDTRQAEKPDWIGQTNDEVYDQLEEIDGRARAKGLTMTQYAIRWLIDQPGIVSVALGITRVEQLEEALTACD
ncbi:MAG: aldo/keto reductase [Armatimonadetes bacterium]|nr:aldo/keto reductase [Armatimonadota bacterium]